MRRATELDLIFDIEAGEMARGKLRRVGGHDGRGELRRGWQGESSEEIGLEGTDSRGEAQMRWRAWRAGEKLRERWRA